MRTKEITVPVKIELEDGTTATITIHHKYHEIDSLSDIKNLTGSDDDKVRIFNYGLDILERGKVRSANNFGSLAKRLVDTSVFDNLREALEFIVHKRGLRIQNPESELTE